MHWDEFVGQEQASKDTIDFKRVYVDMAGDVIAGLLLSQIVYYYLPGRDPNRDKLRVQHQGEYWLAKRREDWWDECRISPFQYDRAAEQLERAALIETRVFRFNGAPTKHIRIRKEVFLEQYAAAVKAAAEAAERKTQAESRSSSLSKFGKVEEPIFKKPRDGNEGNREMEMRKTLKSLTESPSEIPSETTKETGGLPAAPALWEKTLDELRLVLTRGAFNDQLGRSVAIRIEPVADGPPRLTVRVANPYVQEFLEKRLLERIEQAVSNVAGQPVSVRFITES